jgi:uncharacterized damage-inducible protein DinB
MTTNDNKPAATVINPAQLLDHWQGHRRLTRKVIEAFPEDKLFSYSLGGMRPFATMVQEFLDMTVPGLQGAISGKWSGVEDMQHFHAATKATTKKELLLRWDEATDQMNELWPTIPAHRFQELDKAFGRWDGPIYFFIFYWIDNEIHHRGQGTVYLRSLGIEPPAFWDRS